MSDARSRSRSRSPRGKNDGKREAKTKQPDSSNNTYKPVDWTIKCSARANGIVNPIRCIMDSLEGKGNKNLKPISLAQGDPTAYEHLRPSDVSVRAICSVLQGGTGNSYQPSQGNKECREAIAKYFNVKTRAALTANDIFMTFGCSEALSHCVAALAKPGGNLLVPRPGFCLYDVLCGYHEVEPRYYDLLPDQGWEVDIEGMAKLVDENTVGILINNPSNPCGAVYSRSHLTDLMKRIEALKVPVIADEVYANMTFGEPFVPCAEVVPTVPVLSVCALSKRWLAPGWRVGWLIVHDTEDQLLKKAQIPDTFLKLCQVSLGPTAPIQAAIPKILQDTPQEWYTEVLGHLKDSAETCIRRIQSCKGLKMTTPPQGAMYFMVRIDVDNFREMKNCVDFAGRLLDEESIVVLPGACFNAPNYFRVVFAASSSALEVAWDRIERFCERHYMQ